MQKIHLQYFMGNSQNIILLIKYSTQDNHVNRNNYHNNIHHYTDSCKDSINTAFADEHAGIYNMNIFIWIHFYFVDGVFLLAPVHIWAATAELLFSFALLLKQPIMFISRLVFLDSNTAAFHNSQLEAFFWILLYAEPWCSIK